MAALSVHIPENQVEFFKRLIEASPDVLARLPELLAQSEPTWYVPDFERRLARDADLDPRLIKAATVVASSLLVTSEAATVQAKDLPEAVIQGVSEYIDIPFESDERSRLIDFMRAVLESPGNFGVSRKVQHVGLEHEHPFLDARIVTDVRPIFGLSELEIATSVIVHTIRITTREDGQDRSRYFVLDRDDLLQVRELIERALRKEVVIRDRLNAAGIANVRAEKAEKEDN